MARFYSVEDIVDSLCLRSGDILKRNKGLYLECAKDVWEDLNETTLKIADRVKIPIRRTFKVNKRTNSIDIPPFLRLSSVNVIDHCGNFHPVYRNDKLTDDIVDLAGTEDCACEFNCGYKLCNTIKGYEAVVSTKSDELPNGNPISFECTDRKAVDDQGFLISETQYPMRVYLSGVWTNTVLNTQVTKMCKVEVDANGCCCDTEENINAVCDSCSVKATGYDIPVGGTAMTPPHEGDQSWIYYCNSKMDWFSLQCGGFAYAFNRKDCKNNIYNISELGNRLIFPADFGWDNVMVRFYADISTGDIQVPYMARQVFMTGLQYYASEHNMDKQDQSAIFGKKYSRQKWGLFLELNKYRIAELKMITTAPVYVPSYISNNNSGYYDNGYRGAY